MTDEARREERARREEQARRRERARRAAMREAVERLLEWRVPFDKPSDHQLKIGLVNFWPATGAITIDGRPRPSERGLDGLARLVLPRGGAGRGSSLDPFLGPAPPRPSPATAPSRLS